MSWEVVYTIRGAGSMGQPVADENDANSKIQNAITSQAQYLDIDGIKVRREDVIAIQKQEKNS